MNEDLTAINGSKLSRFVLSLRTKDYKAIKYKNKKKNYLKSIYYKKKPTQVIQLKVLRVVFYVIVFHYTKILRMIILFVIFIKLKV